MSVRLAIFDCDGTLVDGQAGVVGAMNVAFVECGLPAPDAHAVRRIVGLSLPQAIGILLPGADEDLRARIDAAYRQAFRAARESGALAEPLYDGVRPALDALLAAGWTLGVATGKARRGLDHCLAMHGIGAHFSTLQTADDHPSKPHPSMIERALADTLALPADTVMIGDTQYDMEMAVNAGVRAIGVDWGYHTPAELRAAGASAIATSPRELIGLLQR